MNDLPETAQAAKGTVLPDGRHFDDLRALGGWHPCAGVEQFENHLPTPSFNGYDIPIHEFAHCIYEYGCDQAFRNSVLQQYEKSLKNNKWVGSYAGRSNGEFFAEMTTWYFGAHGDLTMTGPKPANGPEGLKAYDPDTYRFIDDFYSGRTRIPRFTWTDLTPSTTPPNADDAKSFVEVSAIRVTNLSGRRIAIWRVRPQRVDKIIGELDPNEQRAVIIGPYAKIVILPMGQTPAKDAKWFYSSTVLRGSVIYR